MICGALQTLNEEACEDVLEESEEQGTIAAATYLQVPQQPIDIITGEQIHQSQNEHNINNYKLGECNSNVIIDIN
jgi:ankyrin repeat-rich membrane spanning protein